jgi:hypothetical protein
MGERVFLVHGWSVTETTTYQALHLQLAANGFQLQEIFLGRYVTLENEVEIRDIAKALHNALDEKLNGDWTQPFHIITHSTGALVTREWIVKHYTGEFSQQKPLKNVVFLAGPHFGSRLAHHGRSMLAHAVHLGDTGKKVLNGLELGSALTWELAEAWLDRSNWQDKDIRFYNLIGDRVETNLFKKAIFPAGFEEGSDMVVRVAAGNLNFKIVRIDAAKDQVSELGKVDNIPFGALGQYVHSGPKNGIMNSIKKAVTPATHKSLELILDCLSVTDSNGYDGVANKLEEVTRETRQTKKGFAQVVFRFRDEMGMPIDDYAFSLGYIDNRRINRPSKAVVNTHKNIITPNFFTVFLKMKDLDPSLTYFLKFDSDSNSDLFSYEPDPYTQEIPPQSIFNYISEDRTTLFDVILSREPSENLFVFHRGDDPDLHVKWNRKGEVVKKKMKTK